MKRHAAVTVYDGRTKRTVYALRAGSVRPLGSTTKLFTTVAALKALPELTTSVVGDPAGDLHLVGTGDPTLDRNGMEVLADQVHRAGVRAVAGGIVGDGTRFGPSPPFDPEIGGVLGALVYDRGRAVDGGPLQPDPAAIRRRARGCARPRDAVPAGLGGARRHDEPSLRQLHRRDAHPRSAAPLRWRAAPGVGRGS